MNIQLTEEIIRERASSQSFDKGQSYYQSGAIYEPSQQSIPDGVMLVAYCEGSSDNTYDVSAKLDSGGIRSACCSCPYDWGGDCKHIVALLLTYLNRPHDFKQRRSVTEMIAGLEKETLVAIIVRLIELEPNLYDELESAIPAAKIVVPAQPVAEQTIPPAVTAPPTPRYPTQVSESTYRKQVKRILKQSRYDERGDWDEYAESPAYISDLEEVQQTAIQFLTAGDAEGALIILRVLLEETANDYDSEADYEGDVASFIQRLGMPLAEAILSADLDEPSHQALQDSLEEILEDLDETIDEGELEVISVALEYGWKELPDSETQWDEYDEETWMLFDALQEARLNVLERQVRNAEFLQLAQKIDQHRYVLKLLQLARIEDAIAASQVLGDEYEILSVAQRLREIGRLNEAITLAERGLNTSGLHSLELATWLAPLEEIRGNTDMALRAYRIAFDARPSIGEYRHLKQLSGAKWEDLRPDLIKQINLDQNPDIMVDIHLEEQNWDAAIVLAARDQWGFNLLKKVADAVIPYRPDWVIQVSRKQSDQLIATVQSKNYPLVAQWLARAKKAYIAKGQETEWQVYITNLRTTYARRPALQSAIEKL
jgi:uncharacterized Zn finger protein